MERQDSTPSARDPRERSSLSSPLLARLAFVGASVLALLSGGCISSSTHGERGGRNDNVVELRNLADRYSAEVGKAEAIIDQLEARKDEVADGKKVAIQTIIDTLRASLKSNRATEEASVGTLVANLKEANRKAIDDFLSTEVAFTNDVDGRESQSRYHSRALEIGKHIGIAKLAMREHQDGKQLFELSARNRRVLQGLERELNARRASLRELTQDAGEDSDLSNQSGSTLARETARVCLESAADEAAARATADEANSLISRVRRELAENN